MVTIAAIQMISGSDIQANIGRAGDQIARAADAGADLVVLPENFACFGKSSLVSEGLAEDDFNGPISRFLSETARQHRIWIVGGTLPCISGLDGRLASSDKVFSTTTVWDADGRLVGRYDKIHLFDVDVEDGVGHYRESRLMEAGSMPVCLDTPFGRLGLSVCYDLRFPEYFQLLRGLQAEIIVIPSAFTYLTGKAHWETLLRARAIENQVFIVGANQGGDHGGNRRTWGQSCIIGPWGEMLAQVQGAGAQFAIYTIDMNRLHDIRRQMPIERHRRFVPDLSLPTDGVLPWTR